MLYVKLQDSLTFGSEAEYTLNVLSSKQFITDRYKVVVLLWFSVVG